LDIQKKISDNLDKEREIINQNKELIAIFEYKIKNKIASVWGEEKKWQL